MENRHDGTCFHMNSERPGDHKLDLMVVEILEKLFGATIALVCANQECSIHENASNSLKLNNGRVLSQKRIACDAFRAADEQYSELAGPKRKCLRCGGGIQFTKKKKKKKRQDQHKLLPILLGG